VSAIFAPRRPSGFGAPIVLSHKTVGIEPAARSVIVRRTKPIGLLFECRAVFHEWPREQF